MKPLRQSPRHQRRRTSGATSGAFSGLEYTAMPRSAAARRSDVRPFSHQPSGSPTSLYSHKKYATNTTAKLKISGVRNTAYAGTTLAPTNASVKNSDGPGLPRAARKKYPQKQMTAISST